MSSSKPLNNSFATATSGAGGVQFLFLSVLRLDSRVRTSQPHPLLNFKVGIGDVIECDLVIISFI